jgi:serine/threonine protein kinase
MPGGDLYLAMEWLEGVTLAMRLKLGRMPLGESLSIATSLADALAFAHGLGVVHRDVKPRNVFLVDGVVAKVLDFGLVRVLDVAGLLTNSGVALGTPGYAAPEQLCGERDVGPAADVFALGCVLYECIAGTPAFPPGQVIRQLRDAMFTDPPPLLDVPARLRALVARMLAKDKSRRPADAAWIARELSAIGREVEPPSGA